MLRRRDLLAGAIGTCLAPALARAQGSWPQKPISLVVPFSAGGSADLVARMFAQYFQAKNGVSVVIDNKGGAGGSIGSAFVARATPDGYTLGLGTVSTHAINPALYAKLPFDVDKDFEPISPFVRLPNLLVVNNNVPVKTVAELVAYLKANDGKLNYGSGGNGTSGHLSTVMFMKAIGVTMTHIPYRGTSEEVTALVNGTIDLAIDSMTTIWPLASAGQIRPLAVTTPARVATAPDLPTIGETVAGFEAVGWQGLFAPAQTPRPIVEMLAAEVRRIFLQPELVAALQKVGGEPMPMSPSEFARFAQSERVKWGSVVKDAGIRID
jgi:tripartite-type tricarboxylate transporter receptor subunit TctC